MAVKVFREVSKNAKLSASSDTKAKAHEEIRLLFELRHPCIIGVYAWLDTPNDRVGVVLEYCGLGELRDYYATEEYDLDYGLSLALDVADALAYMRAFLGVGERGGSLLTSRAGEK